jgi:protein-S-isoprenylcysteine O-methyltransferase Ste14
MESPARKEITMSTSNTKQPKRIPRWLTYLLVAIVWGVIPWAVSLLTIHYGWKTGRPGVWNVLGLIPLIVGSIGALWTVNQYFAESEGEMDWEPDKNYLLQRGAYSFSRNPMYLFELILLFGWVIFYGSIAVLIACLVWWAFFNFFQIPQEERLIEARFGETYRQYKNLVPRWIGKIRH